MDERVAERPNTAFGLPRGTMLCHYNPIAFLQAFTELDRQKQKAK